MTTCYTRHADRPRQGGFTLLEVLIALLVLSIGLLGIGKLMMLSARANDSADMRSQATALGYTILDAMRANRQSAIVQAYDTAMGVFPAPERTALNKMRVHCNDAARRIMYVMLHTSREPVSNTVRQCNKPARIA